MENCIFCKIVKGEVPSHKVYEDDELLAFLDIQPINKGHVLVIPKQHHALIAELDGKVLCGMVNLANRVNKSIRESDLKSEGVNLFLADGAAAGQEVPHAHLHVIPRFEKDGFGLVFPEGHKNKPSQEELEEILQKIRSHITHNI